MDYRAVGLSNYGRPEGGFYTRQLKTLTKVAKKQAEDAGPLQRLQEVTAELQMASHSVPDNAVDTLTLVHGDFRIDNLVFHPTGECLYLSNFHS